MENDNEGVFVSAIQWLCGMKKHYLSNFINLPAPQCSILACKAVTNSRIRALFSLLLPGPFR
jgi:hypothetical protein